MKHKAMTALTGLAVLAGVLCGASSVSAHQVPSSDLLLPYFEVDLSGAGQTTFFAVVNSSSSDVRVRMKVSELTLQYLGSVSNAWIEVVQKKDNVEVFAGTVQPGGSFSFVGADKKGTLSTEIRIYVNGTLNTNIHTSCSVPIGPELVSGDFKVLAGTSREAGPLCPL